MELDKHVKQQLFAFLKQENIDIERDSLAIGEQQYERLKKKLIELGLSIEDFEKISKKSFSKTTDLEICKEIDCHLKDPLGEIVQFLLYVYNKYGVKFKKLAANALINNLLFNVFAERFVEEKIDVQDRKKYIKDFLETVEAELIFSLTYCDLVTKTNVLSA